MKIIISKNYYQVIIKLVNTKALIKYNYLQSQAILLIKSQLFSMSP